jgi:hypothetical protein
MLVVRFPPLAHFRHRVLEWALGAITLTVGMTLLHEYPTLDQPALSEMARIASEEFWAWAMILIGLARLGALWINGAWRRSPWIRAATALMCAVVWLQITLGLLNVQMVTLGIAIFPWFLVAEGYSVWRAMSDARDASENKKAKSKSPSVLVIPE